MESRIPLPTDNIFKFYALFGLLLFIFSLGATLVTHKSTNEYMYTTAMDLAAVRAIKAPTEQDTLKRQFLERLIEVAKSDKQFFTYALAVFAAIGFWTMVYGFRRWHKDIQPIEDETRKLQLEKLRLEVAKAKTGEPAASSTTPP